MDKTNIIRYLMTLVHFMEVNSNIINGYGYYDKVEERNKFLAENGIKKMETEPIYALSNYTYKGLEFHYTYYGSEYHVGSGFYFNDKYYDLWRIDDRVDELIADGWTPQDEYVRSARAEEQIKAIKVVYQQMKDVVANKYGWGELGGTMRSHGCYVHYDGGSVCDFSKGFLHCHAHTNEYPKSGWHIEPKCEVYFEDGSLSDSFAVEDSDHHRSIDKHFEWLFGAEISGFGRFYTERELFDMGKKHYDYYRVRYHYPRENGTLAVFDTFEEAKEFAYKEAKERAEAVKDDRRRYAYRNPRDYADLTDTLCAYLYYMYDRGSEHIIFVQGEYK